MDKKQNFSRQGSSRALVSEPRKSSDVSVRKTRSARQRENPNQSSAKYETQRSSKPAKFRPFVDKRPRARGGAGSQPLDVSSASSGLADGDEVLGGLSVELESIYNQGSTKQNLNHLLNFHYAPREHDGSVNASFFGRNGNRSHLKKQKYNKEQFLQANFQFVVKSSAESSIVSASPDTLVDWTLIEQINIQTTEEPQCPICLYPPVAAKLTRCGHAYCWPCVLHYLALTDKNWRKCPICYDAINLSDLKTTAIVQQANIKVSDFVTLQLMRRKKGSMFIEKMGDEEHNQKIPHIAAELDEKKFSKFLLADSCEILSIIERERQELISCSSEDCPEFVFIQQALDLLKGRKATILQEMGALENDDDGNEISLEKINLNKDEISHDGKLGDKMIEDQTVQVNQNANHQPVNLESTSKEVAKYYYFYQSLEGQNVFLHPLNVKILQAMYGCLEKAPPLFKAKVLQKEFQSMDESHRKKFTCLGHLPLTCQFEIVEVQLEPPLVSEEILSLFSDDIALRHKNRMRRAREEKKRERKIFEINERQMGKIISRSANVDIQSNHQFPMCGSDDGSIRSSFGEVFSFDSSDSPSAALPTSSKPNYTSFANILSSPKKESWPSLGVVKNPLTNVTDTVWGKPTVATSAAHCDLTSDLNFLDEAASPLRQNLGDVLAEALQQKKVSADGNNSEKKTGASKKVKKCKKTLLLSTGMSFGGK